MYFVVQCSLSPLRLSQRVVICQCTLILPPFLNLTLGNFCPSCLLSRSSPLKILNTNNYCANTQLRLRQRRKILMRIGLLPSLAPSSPPTHSSPSRHRSCLCSRLFLYIFLLIALRVLSHLSPLQMQSYICMQRLRHLTIIVTSADENVE